MMQNLNQFKQELEQCQKAVIIPHRNPDGDAIGSTLAMKHYLTKKGIQTNVISPNQFPKFLKWLPQAKDIIIAEHQKQKSQILINQADLIFLMDFNTLSRIDLLAPIVAKANAKKVLIDHHQQPDQFDFMYSNPNLPATCQLMYHFVEQMNDLDLLDHDMAECIYTGLITDTGNFRYRSTNSQTLEIAAKLLEQNIDLQKINGRLFDRNSSNRMKLLASALNKIQEWPELRTTVLALDKEDLLYHKFQKGDTEGFVNYGLAIDNTVLAVFFIYDLQKDFVKISFRSKSDFDVNLLARKYFNGGGHTNAAGGKSDLSIPESIERLKEILHPYQEKLQNVEI